MTRIGEYYRDIMIDEIFAHGYGGPNDHPIRWTKSEMHAQATDEDLLSLFQRYVTYYPDPDRHKEAFEREVMAAIAIEKMLANVQPQ